MTSGERPGPPDESVVGPVYDANRSRRHAIMVVAGAATYMTVDFGIRWGVDAWTERFWPDTETTIETVVDGGDPENSPWVAFGGLGRQYNADQGRILEEILARSPGAATKIGGFNYANQGISFDDNARCLEEYTVGRRGLHVLGHSMGSLTALESIARMEEPVHIDTFAAVSSPSGLNDVFRKDDLAMVVESGADGNIAEKFVFQLMTNNQSDRRDFFGRISDVWDRAVHNTPEGVSPKVYVDGLKIIYWARIGSLISQFKERGIITPKTRVLYLKTPRDRTVIPGQACDSFQGFFTHDDLKADFNAASFDGNHADVRAASKILGDWFDHIGISERH